ncbi:MAG: 3'(2'),5'-bisphosphate nucleotidase CysQ [Rhodospirillales bacterium]|nr:3'(2'),5'-bisphosphate nucleotidase CysQ [Rhodospirillales bacterium]
MTDFSKLLAAVTATATRAGALILSIYESDFAVRAKADSSPVTEADELGEAEILKALAELTPDIPVVSEEAAAAGHIPSVDDRFWLVDPLDGTKEFVKRNGEFTVNIALVEHGMPVLGVVHAPALGRTFAGSVPGGAAVTEPDGRVRLIAVRDVPDEGLTVVASRSHGDPALLDAFLAGRKAARIANAGSSLKFCLVAAGEADVYPRFGPTMEWDTAAGHAVVLAAGGRVTDADGRPLTYGKPGFRNPHFIVWGRAS